MLDAMVGIRRSGIALALVVALATFGVPAAGAVAAAPTGWALQATPNPPGAQDSLLSGVSCASKRMCVAVGKSTAGGFGVPETPLAEGWNGKRWRVQATADPTTLHDSILSAVSCPSTRSCVAVGNSFDLHAGTAVTLAEVWNGRTWRIQPTPNPTGSMLSILSAVSCTSRRSCVAVGNTEFSDGHEVPLAEVWNGRAWTVTPVPNLANSFIAVLSGVSCTSRRSCVAVGESSPNFDVVTLAEVWDGRTWTIQPTPNQSAASNNELTSVSCSARTTCMAVGTTTTFDGFLLPLAEVWNGTTWALQAIQGPLVPLSQLRSVSCPSTVACVAVGDSFPPDESIAVSFAEIWDGRAWTVEPTADLGSGYKLSAVSCSSRRACTAVGDVLNGTRASHTTLAERRT